MLDPKLLRNQLADVAAQLRRRAGSRLTRLGFRNHLTAHRAEPIVADGPHDVGQSDEFGIGAFEVGGVEAERLPQRLAGRAGAVALQESRSVEAPELRIVPVGLERFLEDGEALVDPPLGDRREHRAVGLVVVGAVVEAALLDERLELAEEDVEVGLLQQALLQLALVVFLIDFGRGQPLIEFNLLCIQLVQPRFRFRDPLA